MRWLLIVCILVGVGVLVRIYFNLRKLRTPVDDDWDARQIAALRARGSDPFQSHDVDFFFGMPSTAACEAVRSQLELEGYAVDTKPVPEAVDQIFSLHASKSMRLSVPDMQELSHRFGELARAHGGRYDGWSAGIVPQHAPGRASH